MPLTVQTNERKCSARLEGDVTIYEAVEIKTGLAEIVGHGGDIELDLSEVKSFDTAGFQLLLWLRRELERDARNLCILHWSEPVAEVIAIYGLENKFAQNAGSTAGTN